MQLRKLNVGCFGGGTGLPSLLGGLEDQSLARVHAVVTMFDSGGSSGQLRDELGVLPPGDVLKCALALARNEREARRVLLSRLPMLEHARLRGHTGGNLLLSMMEQYSGDFLAAVDGLARAARLRRPGLAGQHRAGEHLRRVRRRLDAPAARSKSTPGRAAAMRSRASGSSRPAQIRAGDGQGDPRLRRGDHRARQLLHQPDADLPGARRGRGDPRSVRAGHPGREPADRRARHVAVHRRRRRAAPERRDRAAGRRGRHQHRATGRREPRALPGRAQDAARVRRHSRALRGRSPASSGAATSPGTTGGVSPRPSGRCWRAA